MNQWKDTTIHGYLWLMGKLSGQCINLKLKKDDLVLILIAKVHDIWCSA